MLFVAILALSPCPRAHAQAVYAMFSAGHYSGLGVGSGTKPDQSGGITSLGGTFGFYDDYHVPGPIRVGVDARLIVENSANSTPYGDKLTAGFFGVRVDGSGARLLPVNPFVQLEAGVAGTNNGTSYDRSASFAYQVQFGGDFPLLIPHLDGRLEYGAGQVEGQSGGNSHTLQTFSAGLVLRLDVPHKHYRRN
jgi:hypothetical protein